MALLSGRSPARTCPLDVSTGGIGPLSTRWRGRPYAREAQAAEAQLVVHTQHSPLLALHAPDDDVTVHGADTLVSKFEVLQSQVSPHTTQVGRWPRPETPTVSSPAALPRRAHWCSEMTTASPPRLSINPVRFAFRCRITPASFCIQRSPALALPIAKP
jgi:hypothetical protein